MKHLQKKITLFIFFVILFNCTKNNQTRNTYFENNEIDNNHRRLTENNYYKLFTKKFELQNYLCFSEFSDDENLFGVTKSGKSKLNFFTMNGLTGQIFDQFSFQHNENLELIPVGMTYINGSYIITGNITDENQNQDIFVLSIDKAQNVNWLENIGKTNFTENPRSIYRFEDKFIIGATLIYYYDYNPLFPKNLVSIAVIEFSQNGKINQIKQVTFFYYSIIDLIIFKNSNTFLEIGRAEDASGFKPIYQKFNYTTNKLLWGKDINYSNKINVEKAFEYDNEEIIFVGHVENDFFGSIQKDGFLFFGNSTGDTKLTYLIGSQSNIPSDEKLYNLLITNNSLIFLGTTKTNDQNYSSIITLNFSRNFEFLNAKILNNSYCIDDHVSIKKTSDNGAIVFCNTIDNSTFLAKFSNDGNITSDCFQNNFEPNITNITNQFLTRSAGQGIFSPQNATYSFQTNKISSTPFINFQENEICYENYSLNDITTTLPFISTNNNFETTPTSFEFTTSNVQTSNSDSNAGIVSSTSIASSIELPYQIKYQNKGDELVIILLSIIGVFLFFLCCGCIIFFYFKKNSENKLNKLINTVFNKQRDVESISKKNFVDIEHKNDNPDNDNEDIVEIELQNNNINDINQELHISSANKKLEKLPLKGPGYSYSHREGRRSTINNNSNDIEDQTNNNELNELNISVENDEIITGNDELFNKTTKGKDKSNNSISNLYIDLDNQDDFEPYYDNDVRDKEKNNGNLKKDKNKQNNQLNEEEIINDMNTAYFPENHMPNESDSDNNNINKRNIQDNEEIQNNDIDNDDNESKESEELGNITMGAPEDENNNNIDNENNANDDDNNIENENDNNEDKNIEVNKKDNEQLINEINTKFPDNFIE